MSVSSRWYKAAGASIIAGAITARYVAKWKRQRSLRLRFKEDLLYSPGKHYIGLDLNGFFAKAQGLCHVAVLDPELQCEFSSWDYQEDGVGIVPKAALGNAFLLAIAGPQGLARLKSQDRRLAEKAVNVSNHTTDKLPTDAKPSANFIKGSVKLFYRLAISGGRFRLLGLDQVSDNQANLIEVYPDQAWKVLASKTRLPRKESAKGREMRRLLLTSQGVQFGTLEDPTHHQLDAALSALIAYIFTRGQTTSEGTSPWLDHKELTLREGYIVGLTPGASQRFSREEEPVGPTG